MPPTVLTEDEMRFWLQASQSSLTDIWDNEEEDVYAELLEDPCTTHPTAKACAPTCTPMAGQAVL